MRLKKTARFFCIFWGVIFAMVALGGITSPFSNHNPENLLVTIVFAPIAFLLLKKKRARPSCDMAQKQSEEHTVSAERSRAPLEQRKVVNRIPVNTNLNPDRAINSMKGAYTIPQAKNHIRVLQDCLSLIEKAKNLETFFSRAEYGMQIALTLNQAQQAGIIPSTTDFPSVFFEAVRSQKERILTDSFWDQKEKIEKYATSKTKTTHWKRYIELLDKYSDQYDLEFQDEFQEVRDQALSEISKLNY